MKGLLLRLSASTLSFAPVLGSETPGSLRVLVVGDSFVWGPGVDARDAYPRRLEERLAGQAPLPAVRRR